MTLFPPPPSPLGLVWPLQFEYYPGYIALAGFAILALPVVWLGMRSLAGLGPTRKWVAIGIRLLVLLLIVLVLCGARWRRQASDLEVMVLRDISGSTANVRNYPGKTLQSSLDNYLSAVAGQDKPPADKIGQISFERDSQIDSLPGVALALEGGAIRNGSSGTDAASAIQLGLATLRPDAMHRMLLIWDGNATQGDTNAAIAAAVSQHVPIDVMPLHYDVQHEVLMDKLIAPTWKREDEPFSLDVFLKSTDNYAVTGTLTVLHQGVPMDLDPSKPGIQPRMKVTLELGLNPFHIQVPALKQAGVHTFHASFEPDAPAPGVVTAVQGQQAVDTLTSNNSADAFTFVRGKGQVLYVDNTPDGRGNYLMHALNQQGIHVSSQDHITPDEFPSSLMKLQNYDAIILANVSRGLGGLSDDAQKNLATYVHDMGGGLVMIGGPDAFGAGGWQGSRLEEVLPVNMDIPAQRQIPKGALVLAMDSAEAPNGNYWGEQCAIKAMGALSRRDDVGIITYNWNKGGGGCQWDLPLGEKGDGSKGLAAIKNWGLGDLPSFEEAVNLALDGDATSKGLIADDARQKHIIIITDDDPQMPTMATIDRCIKAHITVSTVTVYPHQPHHVAPGTRRLATLTGGRSFGPIEDNPGQLPQIFVKEATVVRRSLITENADGIALKLEPSTSDMITGINHFPDIFGMVLTSRKNNPQITMPIVAGKNNDPVLAEWQTGLGKAAVYTSDANNQWGAQWVGSPEYDKLWAQIVRTVARPPMSSLFDIQTTQSGGKGHITVSALNNQSGFQNFLNIAGAVAGPNPSIPAQHVHLVQTGPGQYQGSFNTPDPGTYVAAMEYRGQGAKAGMLLSGVAMNSDAEMRDLQSNDGYLKQIADRTGGQMLTPFNVKDADLFRRQGLHPAISPLPIWDILVPILIGLILVDVASRRIAWDLVAMRKYATSTAGAVRAFTTTRQVETRASLDALQRIRSGEASAAMAGVPMPAPVLFRPKTAAAKFEASGPVATNADLTKALGGASKDAKPVAKKPAPEALTGGMSSLMEAKRRAQQQIKLKEEQ